MSERPAAPPEGTLITAALKRTKLSARAAARQAGISDARWRQITSGYQTVSGTQVAVRAPADTLARMAQVVGVTPEQLEEADRADAAAELRELPPPVETEREPSAREIADRMVELTAWFKVEHERDRERIRRLEEEVERLRKRQSG